MQEERRPLDPTRRMLRVFGVKVTDYEERMAALLERARRTESTEVDERLGLALEALDLSADLNARLREMTAYVLDLQNRMLGELRAAIQPGQGVRDDG